MSYIFQIKYLSKINNAIKYEIKKKNRKIWITMNENLNLETIL